MKKSKLCIVLLVTFVICACSKDNTEVDPNNGNEGNNGGKPTPEIRLELSEYELFVDPFAISKTVLLTADADWTIDQNFTETEWAWCSVTPVYGSAGATKLTVDIQANGYDKRSHAFLIKSGDVEIPLTVEHKQIVSFLIGGDKEFIFYDEGGQIEVTGASSVGCEILYLDGAADWISELKNTRALEPLNFRFRIAPYTGSEWRKGRIVLKAPGEELADTVRIIQYHDKVVDIPDVSFRKYCLTNFDTNNDGEITKRETEGVWEIEAINLNIRTVEGIEEFSDLTSFDCSENQIAELDVSNNEKLTYLSCENNALTTLDVRYNKKLIGLSCDHNQISTLLFDRREWLTFGCSYNQISSLGTEPIGAQVFACSNNPIETLTLDTSFVEENRLVSIFCSNTLLSKLDLSKCTNVNILYSSGNKLQRLDLAYCKNLTILDCENNLLEEILLPENGKLSTIDAYKNRLKKIDLHQMIFLTNIWISENELEMLDCSDCVSLEKLSCEKNKLQILNLSNCRMLNTIRCDNNLLTILDLSETNLNKSSSSYSYPLDCAPMPTLETVYLKKGWNWINGINFNRNANYIPETTQILYR